MLGYWGRGKGYIRFGGFDKEMELVVWELW